MGDYLSCWASLTELSGMRVKNLRNGATTAKCGVSGPSSSTTVAAIAIKAPNELKVSATEVKYARGINKIIPGTAAATCSTRSLMEKIAGRFRARTNPSAPRLNNNGQVNR